MDWTWTAVLCVALAGRSSAQTALTRRWIVTFEDGRTALGAKTAAGWLGGAPAALIAGAGNSDHEFSAAVWELPEGRTPPALNPEDLRRAGIVSIEPDIRWKWIETGGFGVAPFPLISEVLMARGELTWGINRIHAPDAWAVTQGADVKVAVIDSGIDAGHPDLAGNIDGGYSALAKTENPADYQDDNGHGTQVAGIIAARRDDKGVVGVAPRARLYSVKVLNGWGEGRLSDVVDGIVWAAKKGAQVANLSLGIPVDSPALHQAVKYAEEKGVVLIAASGNSGGPVQFPGAYPEVVAVSASDAQDRTADFSGRGREVRFTAPGVDVVSDRLGGGVASMSGTSMAAPHVAGLAALAVGLGWSGAFGPDGVVAQLKKAASPLPGVRAEEQGAGEIDAGKLVR